MWAPNINIRLPNLELRPTKMGELRPTKMGDLRINPPLFSQNIEIPTKWLPVIAATAALA
jgi:hypothetical protein